MPPRTLTWAAGCPLDIDGDARKRVPRRQCSLDNQAKEHNHIDARVALGNVNRRLQHEPGERDPAVSTELYSCLPAAHEKVRDDGKDCNDEKDDRAGPV
jgi:hypothetical protein